MLIMKYFFFKQLYSYICNKTNKKNKQKKQLCNTIKNYYYSTFGKTISSIATTVYSMLEIYTFINNIDIKCKYNYKKAYM